MTAVAAKQKAEAARHRTNWSIRKFRTREDYEAWRDGVGPGLFTAEELSGESIEGLEKALADNGPYSENNVEGNILLNEGITALLNLLTGAVETAFNNANSVLGVGDSAAAEAATQTALQAGANKLYKAMEATYPQISGQGVIFRAVFGNGEAEFAWNEFSVSNQTGDAGDNLNRKVSAEGTKAAGQTWTLDLTITFS